MTTNKDTVYEVHMNGLQVDIINQALQLYHSMLSQRSPMGSRTEEQDTEICEVALLIGMSDRKGNNAPEPLPILNGWCL